MDLRTIIAAVPVIRRAWKVAPPALRVPLVVAGAAWAAWQWYSERDIAPGDGSGGPGTTSA